MNCHQLIRLSSRVAKQCLRRQTCHQSVRRASRLVTISSLTGDFKPKTTSAQNLVIDLSFDDLMTTDECHRLARDLYTIYCLNTCLSATNDKTFNVNVCNEMSRDSITLQCLRQYLPQMQTRDNFKVHDKSYNELFSRERLVYLSPDAKDVIDFDVNDIYIMGGLVEKNIFRRKSNRATLLKAKSEGLRVGRFPIDHMISDAMKRGIVLFLPQVFSILNDVKVSHDWESAVRRHLPFWKLKPIATQQAYQSLRCL